MKSEEQIVPRNLTVFRKVVRKQICFLEARDMKVVRICHDQTNVFVGGEALAVLAAYSERGGGIKDGRSQV